MQLKSTVKLAAISTIAFFMSGCLPEQNADSREQGAKQQENIMQKAISRVPTYIPDNFLTREAVNEWMRRMDTPQKTFYIYVMANNGQQLGYYVGKTRPISSCTLLTPPDKPYRVGGTNGNTMVNTSAPSLDGVYGKGGCDSYFFFDATTDAYIEIKGLNFFVADQPLAIEVDPITVKQQ